MIYIPLWLDLLSLDWQEFWTYAKNLHSTMVRFIIDDYSEATNKNQFIYIPLWLDLL